MNYRPHLESGALRQMHGLPDHAFGIDGDQRHGLFSVRAMLIAQPSISGQSRLSPNRPPKAWKNKREGNGH